MVGATGRGQGARQKGAWGGGRAAEGGGWGGVRGDGVRASGQGPRGFRGCHRRAILPEHSLHMVAFAVVARAIRRSCSPGRTPRNGVRKRCTRSWLARSRSAVSREVAREVLALPEFSNSKAARGWLRMQRVRCSCCCSNCSPSCRGPRQGLCPNASPGSCWDV